MKLSGWVKNRDLPLVLLILISILIGFVVARSYGTSWDEPAIVHYADQCIQAYPAFLRHGEVPYFGDTNLMYYGPAFFVLDEILTRVFTWLFPAWSAINAWHFGFFISFQVAVVSLYLLCRKWMDRWASFGAAALFLTQPLLWGHAFINPKDIPFMAFFLASVTAGFSMVDAILAREDGISSKEPKIPAFQKGGVEWGQVGPQRRRAIWLIYIGLLALLLFLISGAADKLASLLVTYAYQADSETVIGSWFGHLASHSDQIPVEGYVAKGQVLLQRGVWAVFLIGVLVGSTLIVKSLPTFAAVLYRQALLPYLQRYVFSPRILWAGILLGLTTSIRILGPFAGGLVILYALSRSWKRAVLLVAPYALPAVLICFITWPYLWGNPIDRFVESFQVMLQFPWHGLLLFRGVLLSENDLPAYFIPYMMGIQLTETILLLFLVGITRSTIMIRKVPYREMVFLVLLWFLVPIIALMIFGNTVYDNFRQFFFLLPPLFVAAGVGLEAVFRKLVKTGWRIALLLVLLSPGVYSILKLHPYQYIYSNSIVGGVRGAFRQYELDYWGTSYAEAAEYVNEIAAQGASVVVMGPVHVFRDFARPDLRLFSASSVPSGRRVEQIQPGEVYDYLVVYTRKNEDLDYCRDAPTIHAIQRNDAVLTVIRRISLPGEECILIPQD